jgi:hypothetical protein
MELPYKITDDKKSIYVSNGYTDYLIEIHKEIIDNQISILNYKSYIDIGTNFNFPNNPIKEIAYIPQRLSDEKFKKQNLNNLPEKLQILKLNSVYVECYKLDNLPFGLKVLYLPISYEYELDNLPLELEDLSLRVNNTFQQSLSYLPESLKELRIISLNNNEMVKINCDNLPNGLEKLFLRGSLNCELNNLPRNLKTLYLTRTYNNMIYNLPDGIEELKISIDYKFLKEIFSSTNTVKLKKIIIGDVYNNHLHTISSFNLNSIPDSVEEIVFGDTFNQKLTYLPKEVKKITFGFNYNQPIGYGDLPDSIEYLEFGYNFNDTINKYPSNLKVLKFGRNYSSNIENLPDGLVELEINERFNSKLSNLPTTLEILRFNKYAEYSHLDKLELPDSIQILQLSNYKKLHGIKNIPKSLKYIKYSKSDEKITKFIEEIGWIGKIEYWNQ